ncbi:MAG: glycosyltransferase 87 family protein [Candidatus Nanopelagicales bacterium]|nr:glycosyltransferase 87 family protein [Candidatus Nanopelagicales bacterium]
MLSGISDRLARGSRLRWWLASRGLVLLVAGGMMLHHDWKHVFDDLNVYARWGEGLAEGRVPSWDPMWQYPPLAAFVFGGVGLLGSQPWMFAILFVLVDIAISVLLARACQRTGRWEAFAVWLAAPLLIGPLLYGRYDGIPTLFAMGGLLAIAAPVAAGAILAVGGGLKVWPAVMALAMSRRSWLPGALGAAVVAVAIVAVSAWAFPSVISSFLGNGEARGLQTESVAALPFVWARGFVGPNAIPEAFRYGSSEVDHWLADATAPWLLPLTAVGLLALIVARALGRLEHVPVADLAFVTILWLVVTSRVLSPQYNVWLVGMAALVWLAGSRRMRLATVPIAVTAVAAQALYPFAYVDIINGGIIGITFQTVRILALLAAMGLAVWALLPDRTARPGTVDAAAEQPDAAQEPAPALAG